MTHKHSELSLFAQFNTLGQGNTNLMAGAWCYIYYLPMLALHIVEHEAVITGGGN